MSVRDVKAILKLRVPVIVRLAHRQMKLSEVMNLGPGALVELPKPHDEPLELMVNNKLIGHGAAVKVGERFGIKVAAVGDAEDRIRALGPVGQQLGGGGDADDGDVEAEAGQADEAGEQEQ